MGLIATLFLVAILAPVIAPNDPYQTDIMNQQQGPSAKYPFGTDHLGRCVLSRILYGATTSLFSSLGIIAIVFLVGSILGILAGYFGGVLDTIIMRITTILQAFPRLILAIALAGVLGVGIGNTILALCVIYWTEYARIARSLVLSIKERTYLKSARVCGENHATILVKHVIPNVFPSCDCYRYFGYRHHDYGSGRPVLFGAGRESPYVRMGFHDEFRETIFVNQPLADCSAGHRYFYYGHHL